MPKTKSGLNLADCHSTVGLNRGKPVFTVDPGLGGTGWAYFTDCQEQPVEFGTLRYRRGSWKERAREYAQMVGGLVSGFGNPPVLMEWPGFWGGSLRSLTSLERGDLFKLCFLIGAMAQAITSRLVLVSPMMWKGQLSKDAVRRRIKRAYGDSLGEFSAHCVDAIGIGMSVGGVL